MEGELVRIDEKPDHNSEKQHRAREEDDNEELNAPGIRDLQFDLAFLPKARQWHVVPKAESQSVPGPTK